LSDTTSICSRNSGDQKDFSVIDRHSMSPTCCLGTFRRCCIQVDP
jgi:hypothetical protein